MIWNNFDDVWNHDETIIISIEYLRGYTDRLLYILGADDITKEMLTTTVCGVLREIIMFDVPEGAYLGEIARDALDRHRIYVEVPKRNLRKLNRLIGTMVKSLRTILDIYAKGMAGEVLTYEIIDPDINTLVAIKDISIGNISRMELKIFKRR